ncbi:MAG: hypothetical protein RLZZ179_2868 [Verrucomicrobiota bacterium]|jgi:hypothetical protein
MSETADSANPTPSSRRRRRRREFQRPRGQRWLVAISMVLITLLAAYFSLTVWLDGYLKSDRFREWISARISDRLKATARIDGVSWRGASAFVSSFEAAGSPEASFATLSANDIRADLNAGAIWDRAWHVERVQIARASLQFPSVIPDTTVPTADPPQTGDTPAPQGGFLSSFLPNRVVLGPIRTDSASLDWKSAEASVTARGMTVEIKPSDDDGFVLASGTGGTVKTSFLPATPIEIEDFDASWQKGEVRLDSFRASAANASINGEATVRTASNPPQLDARVWIAGLELAGVIPPDWLKRLSGTARADIRLTGNPLEAERLACSGSASLAKGLIEGLPILQIIARKTRNESFVRLVLKEARTDFTRTPDGDWLLEKLLVDSPGLLRLKGSAAVGATETLSGSLLLGIVPGTLRYLAGAEQEVFLPIEKANLSAAERALLSAEDAGLLWTRLTLGGSLANPSEDLSDRLARAWFNATVDEVLSMSMEGAVKAAETASRAANDAASAFLEKSPEAIDKGADLLRKGAATGGGILQKGAESGIRAIEGLLPR